MDAQNDIVFMQKALALARKAAEQGEVPIGALIVSSQGVILGSGFNQTETKKCQDQHAEMNAIRAACAGRDNWRLDECTLYVTLEPCVMCLGATVLSRIERLVYAAHSPKFGYHVGRENSCQLYAQKLKNITTGVCKEESEALLKAFFVEQRQK